MPKGLGRGFGMGGGSGRGYGMGRGSGRGYGMGRGRRLNREADEVKNDSTQEHQGQNLKAFINQEECVGCAVCVNACSVGAITADDIVKIDLNKCIGCGDCIDMCPRNAISLKMQ